MPTDIPRHEALRQLAADPQAQGAVQAQAGTIPADVNSWLAGLQTLTGVPFAYLVPDARMLPPESIRFFAVDPNWTAALVDGALSLAARTAPGAAAMAALRPGALAASRQLAASRARGAAAPPAATATSTAPAYSGFLARSAVVAGWPGLRVSGYADTQAAAPALPIARLERLAPSVLLALFVGVIQRVEITEPAQHLHFGITAGSPPTVPLRWIDPANAGGQPPGDPTAPVSFRTDPDRTVIDVTATVTAVTKALAQAYQQPPNPRPMPSFGPAGLSLQMLQGTHVQAFTTATLPSLAARDPARVPR